MYKLSLTLKLTTLWVLLCASVSAMPYAQMYDDSDTVEPKQDWDLDGVHTECVNAGDFALTFDDGPAQFTGGVLDVLREEGVKATFFLNGQNSMLITSPTAQDILKRIHSEGHEIGSHTWSHADLCANKTREEILQEMQQVEVAVQEILGFQMTLMRPPYGSVNESVADILMNELNYDIINWNLDSNDWRLNPNTTASMEYYVEAMEAEGVSHLNSTFIALNHDLQSASKNLTKAVIDYVREKGYNFVTVRKCIGKEEEDEENNQGESPNPDNSLGTRIYLGGFSWLIFAVLNMVYDQFLLS